MPHGLLPGLLGLRALAYPPRALIRVPRSDILIAAELGTRIKSLSMRVDFPEWIYSLGCPGTAEDRSKERIL